MKKIFVDIPNDVNDCCKEYKENGTGYSDTDRNLRIIEIHISLLKTAADFFEQSYECMSKRNQQINN